ASLLAAAIAIGDQVVHAVTRVVAAGHPGSGCHRRARRAGSQCTAAAVTDVAVDGTVTPVITGLRILVLRLPAFTGQAVDAGGLRLVQATATVHRQQRQQRG